MYALLTTYCSLNHFLTLQGTNISPPSRHFWVDDFPFLMMGYVAFLQVNLPCLTRPTDYTTLLKGVENEPWLLTTNKVKGWSSKCKPWKSCSRQAPTLRSATSCYLSFDAKAVWNSWARNGEGTRPLSCWYSCWNHFCWLGQCKACIFVTIAYNDVRMPWDLKTVEKDRRHCLGGRRIRDRSDKSDKYGK